MNTLSKLFVIFLPFLLSCSNGSKNYTSEDFKLYLKEYEQNVIPLETELNLATYNASVSGKQSDYREATSLAISLSRVYADRKTFELLHDLKKSNNISDSLLLRQLNVLYYKFLPYQTSEQTQLKLIMLETETEQTFSTYRPIVNGLELDDIQIDEILKNSTDSKELEIVWKASKEVGAVISQNIVEIVKLRNQEAQELGYSNYYDMSLEMNNQKGEVIDEIFDELDLIMRDRYAHLKKEMDSLLAIRYNISVKELKPWHYQDRFFQSAPNIYQVNLDSFFINKDLVILTKKYFQSIGLPIDDILNRSNLYPLQDKAQHPYSVDIDRNGDVRILSNIKPSHYWMNALLYEAGFAIYLKNIDRNLPYILREPSHFFLNDAIAILFSRFSSNPQWLQMVVQVPTKDVERISKYSYKNLQLEKYVFTQWAQVMYRFEKALYKNPDQDLNNLWWNLVETYQLLKRPTNRNQADWASKAHIVTMPCSYHNYMLGELFASQLYNYINNEIIGESTNKMPSWYNNPKVGQYLITNVFAPGHSLYWDELIRQSTKAQLDPAYFRSQLE